MPSPIQISIPERCHENWQEMTPREQGRFCAACQKTVVDFTLMTDQEVLHYFSNAGTGVCGRFSNHQLNKTYREPEVMKVKGWRYAWNMVVATFLFTGNAAVAQGKVDVSQTQVEEPVKKPAKQRTKPRIKFSPAENWLASFKYEIDPTCFPQQTTATYGFVLSVRPMTTMDRIMQQWDNWFGQELTVFPQTALPGTAVNLSIKVKEKGSYTLEILDAGGKQMYVKQLPEIEKINTLKLPTEPIWEKGTYWVRLTSPWARKVYHARLVLK